MPILTQIQIDDLLLAISCYSATAGLLFLETHTKNQFGKQPEGFRQFRDHRWKALGEENSDLSWLFLFRHYFGSYIE